MSQKVNWEYYSSFFSKISEADFNKAEAQAEKEVKAVIGPLHWDDITEETYGYDVLKDCICKTMDKMAENARSGKGKGVSSVNNDGYSESYVIQTEDQLRSELHASIRSWLSGTGLVRAY